MSETTAPSPEPQQPQPRPTPEADQRDVLTGSGALMQLADAAMVGLTTGIGLKVGEKLLDRPPKDPPPKIELPAGVRDGES